MPLNSIPATTVAALEAKRAAAQGQIAVDVGFLGGVVPGNAGQLPGLHAAGVRAFKCFLVRPGSGDFPSVTEPDLRATFRSSPSWAPFSWSTPNSPDRSTKRPVRRPGIPGAMLPGLPPGRPRKIAEPQTSELFGE
jgi:hypothetical protein